MNRPSDTAVVMLQSAPRTGKQCVLSCRHLGSGPDSSF